MVFSSLFHVLINNKKKPMNGDILNWQKIKCFELVKKKIYLLLVTNIIILVNMNVNTKRKTRRE